MNSLKFVLPLYLVVFFSVFNNANAAEEEIDFENKSPKKDTQFSLMNLLAEKGLHDMENESWNMYGQFNYISYWHGSFNAPYTNLNGSNSSLNPNQDYGYTGSGDLYFGLKTWWDGGEIYAAPESIAEAPFSNLKGIGGLINDFELQKNGGKLPIVYRSRAYFKQTIDLGGEKVHLDSAPMQLGSTVDSRRLTFRVGSFSILDFFDKNSYSGDLRRQFMNMGFMTHTSYDFASDARGYSFGGVVEYFHDDWAIRFGRITPPKNPNDLPIDYRIFKYYGDQVEIEHHHKLFGRDGAVRLLGYRNHLNTGRFDEAIAAFQNDPSKNATTCTGYNYESENATAPDLCWARRPQNKMGIGINLEQQVTDDVGLFFRGMYSDGKTEVFAYTSADRSISFGALANGMRWGRDKDQLGVGYAQSWISGQHAKYLGMGGVDGFIGDGKINYSPERAVNVFYSVNLLSSLWVTGDYQLLVNPAFNSDRGPVDIYSVKMHVEF
ncbi:MAG: carbohydrate porin [Methylococcales bacterium]|nr:carbohydrate porin [Methylococcales bacterium]MDD5753326.1 carbohydrate porin [Methylococcales bacterium]